MIYGIFSNSGRVQIISHENWLHTHPVTEPTKCDREIVNEFQTLTDTQAVYLVALTTLHISTSRTKSHTKTSKL